MTLTDAIELYRASNENLKNGVYGLIVLFAAMIVPVLVVQFFQFQKFGLVESLTSSKAGARLRVIAWSAVSLVVAVVVVSLTMTVSSINERNSIDKGLAEVDSYLQKEYGITFKSEEGARSFLAGFAVEGKVSGESALIRVIDRDDKPKIVIYHGETLQTK